MAAYQLDLNYRLGSEFSSRQFKTIAELIVKHMGFDEGTHYELEVENQDNLRQEHEIGWADLENHLNDQSWPAIHQVILANQWIKDMNIKLRLVKRPGNCALTIKGEAGDLEFGKRLASALDTEMAALQQVENAYSSHQQEREHLFGSMLLSASVSNPAREPFLQGRYLESLAAGYRVLEAHLERLLQIKPSQIKNVDRLLNQTPPRLLLSDLSGQKLRQELDGLAKLITGTSLLLAPLLTGKQSPPMDPAPVLKYLVLISLLVERLETAAPNKTAATAAGKHKSGSKPVAAEKRTAKKSSSRLKTAGSVKKVPPKKKTKVVKTGKTKRAVTHGSRRTR